MRVGWERDRRAKVSGSMAVAYLAHAQVEARGVAQKFGLVVKLGDELLHIGQRGVARGPCLLDRIEEPIRVVKPPGLQVDGVGRVRLQGPHEDRTLKRSFSAVSTQNS